jgi:hypothetical protein
VALGDQPLPGQISQIEGFSGQQLQIGGRHRLAFCGFALAGLNLLVQPGKTVMSGTSSTRGSITFRSLLKNPVASAKLEQLPT